MDTFGKRLKLLRKLKGKQQKEVAIDIGISKTGYSAYENDTNMPGIKTLIKIADYYNVSIDYLLCRYDNFFIDKGIIESKINNLESNFKSNINEIRNYIKLSK